MLTRFKRLLTPRFGMKLIIANALFFIGLNVVYMIFVDLTFDSVVRIITWVAIAWTCSVINSIYHLHDELMHENVQLLDKVNKLIEENERLRHYRH